MEMTDIFICLLLLTAALLVLVSLLVLRVIKVYTQEALNPVRPKKKDVESWSLNSWKQPSLLNLLFG